MTVKTHNHRSILPAPLQGVLLMVAACAASLFMSSTASAQFGNQAGFAEAFQKDFLRRDMQLFVDYLRLEDWQRPIIEVLLDDYQVSFDAGTEACKDQMANLKDEMLANPDRAMEIALRPIKDWESEKKRMGYEFIENIRAQLSPLQMQRWESLERAMRREKELPLGELPGEKMNVFAVLHGMELSPDHVQSIDPLLLTYEVQLDVALDNRRQQMEKYQPQLQDAMVSRDYEAGLQGLRKIAAARAQVTTAHLVAIDDISGALPVEFGDEFRLTILSRGYPDIFKRNSVDRLIAAVRALPDLTPEQAAGLDQIEGEYLVALAESNERLLQAYRANAEEIPVLQAKQSIARRNKEEVKRGANMPQEITSEKTSRDLMLEEFRLRILELLKPEQSANIPAAAKFDRRGRKGRDMERPIGSANPNGAQSPGASPRGRPSGGNGKQKEKRGNTLTPSLPSQKSFDTPPKPDQD